MTQFYLEHSHSYKSLNDITFIDYVNVDYRVAEDMLIAYCTANNYTLTDDNRNQIRSEFVQRMAIK